MKVEDLTAEIERVAPPRWAASWDRSGIQCVATTKTVSKAAVCLDPTPEAVEKAIQHGAQFILSHHPLALKPGLPNKFDNFYHTLSLLMRNDVWLYAAHTSLDSNPDGPAGFLAAQLALQNPQVLEVAGSGNTATGEYGFGLFGLLPCPCSWEHLAMKLGAILNLKTLILAGRTTITGPIARVAYCPGSGASLISLAEENKCDLFITGDIKHHESLNSTIPILDVGHHALEEKMMWNFYTLLKNKLPYIEFDFIESMSPLRTIILNSLETENE